MNEIFKKYDNYQVIQDYFFNTELENPKKPHFQYHSDWNKLLLDFYELNLEDDIFIKAYICIDNAHIHNIGAISLGILKAGFPIKRLILILEQVTDYGKYTVVRTIKSLSEEIEKDDEEFWNSILDDIAIFFKEEALESYLEYWNSKSMTDNAYYLMEELIVRGIKFSDDFLMNQMNRASFHFNELLNFAYYFEDTDRLYKYLLTKIPSFLKGVQFASIEQEFIDDVEKWLNGERSKKIEKSLKKVSKNISNQGYYWNYVQIFFYKMPYLANNKNFQIMVNLGLEINFYKMINYLRAYLTHTQITKKYKITLEQWGFYIGEYFYYANDEIIKMLKYFLKKEYLEFFKGICKAEAKGINEIIPAIIKNNKRKGLEFLETLVRNPQRLSNIKLKETVIDSFKKYPESIELMRDLAVSKKVNLRFIGISVLLFFKDESDEFLLKEIESVEGNSKIKALF